MGSPLAGVKSMPIAFGAKVDKHGFAPDLIGYHDRFHLIKTEGPAVELVSSAIEDEFRRNGHQVVDAASTVTPACRINLTLDSFWVSVVMGMWDVHGTVNLAITVQAASGTDDKPFFSRRFSEQVPTDAKGGLSPQEVQDAVVLAVQKITRAITTDSVFLEKLKVVGSK
jgi:hypothetical protein